jgi:glycosyltransferase involved in cell wall biosynthesis
MALYTATALSNEFEGTILAPSGPVHGEARALGLRSIEISGSRSLATVLRPLIAAAEQFAFLATGVTHSLACLWWNALYKRPVAHLHMVHGGAEERLSYGRKRRLNGRPVHFVAVSRYVQERLVANGVRQDQISVVENFMPDAVVGHRPVREPFQESGIRRAAVISRLDPEKRVDVLLAALESDPTLRAIEINVFGTGWDEQKLRSRAAESRLNVRFEGFQSDVSERLAHADLLIHLCPVEPFGLAILEAMAACVPVLVPDEGGAGSLIEPDGSGFHFRANDAASLASTIHKIDRMPADDLNRITCRAKQLLNSRFSESARIADYRNLLREALR